jgi:hypothetical protein
LGYALINDKAADFRQPINVGLPGPKISAFNGIVKKTENAVPVVLIIFGGIDASLRSNAMCSAWRVLETKAFNVVAEFCERGRRGSACEPTSHNNDVKLSLIVGTDQP